MPPRHSAFASALLLVFLSGAAALMHQLLWTRRMVDLLGASAESLTRVFGCFFLGLALGSAAAALLLRRVRRPWAVAALAEVLVAALALPALFVPDLTAWIWPWLGPERLVAWPGAVLKLAAAALVVVPPAFCMGFILPNVAAAVASPPGTRTGARDVLLYAVNTLGGACGLVGAAAFALPALGAQGGMVAAMAVNLLAAAGFLALHRASGQKPIPGEAQGGVARLPLRLFLLAGFSGLGVLSVEIAATQIAMLVATLSFHAPAAILFTVILVLALAAFIAPWLRRITAGAPPGLLLGAVLALAAVLLAIGPLVFMAIVERINPLAENSSVPAFALKLSALTLASFGPGLFVAGLVFPLAIAEAAGSDRSGRSLGWLLAVNGLGGLLGAELAWRFLLPGVGLHLGIGALALGYAFVGILWCLPQLRPALVPTGAAVGVSILAFAALRHLPVVNARAGFSILDVRTGREGTVAVVENPSMGRVLLMSNQYLLGGTGARESQERQAHLALLLHPEPRDVAFIGLATGSTPGAALVHPGVERIAAIELSPLVKRAAGEFFAEFNRGILDDPRANVVVEDGRTFIAASPGRFDAVVGDLFLPWGPGEARLYSVEHFRDVKRSLRPGGVFCQWLAMYQLTPAQFAVIADTFRAVFPKTFLFHNAAGPGAPAVALVGYADDRELNWPEIGARAAASHLGDPHVASRNRIADLYLGRWKDTPGGRINTLGNLAIELDAGAERLTGHPGAKYFYGSRWDAFVSARRDGRPAGTR